MNAPKQLLNALTKFLNDPTSTSPSEGISFQAFVVDSFETCVLMAESSGNPWFFRPFPSPQPSPSSEVSGSQTVANDWNVHHPLTREVQNICSEIVTKPGIAKEIERLVVLQNSELGTVLSFPCNHLNHVATILRKWGAPPENVLRDWRSQLRSFGQPTPNTAETFVTDDGRLVPLTGIIKQLNKSAPNDPKKDSLLGKRSPFLISPPDWPWALSRPESAIQEEQFDLGNPQSSSLSNSGTSFALRANRPQKNSNKNKLWMGAAVLLVASLILASLFLLPNLEQEQIPKPIAKAKDKSALNNDGKLTNDGYMEEVANLSKETKVTKNNSIESTEQETATETMELVTTPHPSAGVEEAESQQNEKMVQALLAELNPIGNNSIRLDQSSPSSIISDVLKPNTADSGLANLVIIDAIEMTSESDDESKSNELNSNDTEAEELKVVTTERGVITLEKPLTLRSAYAKEIVSIGKPVLVKASRCEIELKLSDKVVVEPMEVATIDGSGKATWKIAIEDEAPEMLVRIESKPGARWEIKAWVGLREEREAMLFGIGPRDAQSVGNRLIDYKQRVSFTIESLRTKRSNSRGQSSSVITSQIKQLELQEKEVEKAIERWQVIARLSHFFFDTHEIRMQFTAIEKDLAK
ncbi:MAG: hypothetical protein NTY15_17700 [Planctomycetota bacterium]|nr:hypothetical protein [Planctomycetota bacterium]